MASFEIVLKGFDGNTDKTDHLIKWVSGDLVLVERWLRNANLMPFVKTITNMGRHLTIADGIDIIVNSTIDPLGYEVIGNFSDWAQESQSVQLASV